MSSRGVRALLFDFDGTLWDPEPEIFRAHEEMFREHRQQLDATVWSGLVGTIGFNLWTHLEELTGAPVARVQCRPDEAIAFEDSLAGILAAKRAGIRCVAVPNPMTTSLDLSEADLVIGSFEEVDLSDVLHAMSL